MKKLMIGLGLGLVGLVGWWGWFGGVGVGRVEVSRVIDGDSIELKDGRMIRYINIDTPEVGECFRDESTAMNTELVLGKKVRVEYDYDKIGVFGRELAYVYLGDKMINEELLLMGAGEFQGDNNNKKYETKLVEVARVAYEEGVGKWGICGGEGGCLIKGNLDRMDERWYHLPDFRHYDQVVMRLDKGDRWFCSEEEAINAGFTKARQ